MTDKFTSSLQTNYTSTNIGCNKLPDTFDYQIEKYFPTSYEDLINGQNDWKNIQDIIRISMQGVVDVIKMQEKSIKDLENKLNEKSKEIDMELESRAGD